MSKSEFIYTFVLLLSIVRYWKSTKEAGNEKQPAKLLAAFDRNILYHKIIAALA